MRCEYNSKMSIAGVIVIQRNMITQHNMLYNPMYKTTYNEMYNQTR